MTLFFHNEATVNEGGTEVIRQIGQIFYFSLIGIVSIVILFTLGLIGIVMGAIGISMPIFGLLRTFGVDRIFVIWGENLVPSLLGLPFGILLGIIFCFLSWLSYHALIRYLKWIKWITFR